MGSGTDDVGSFGPFTPPVSDVRRWRCHACGTPVSSNSTGQVRDETGSHHNAGHDRCIRVMQDQLAVEKTRVAELTAANRGRDVSTAKQEAWEVALEDKLVASTPEEVLDVIRRLQSMAAEALRGVLSRLA